MLQSWYVLFQQQERVENLGISLFHECKAGMNERKQGYQQCKFHQQVASHF
jgi:hypothetical protein